jgi:hypothetical protein
MAHSIMIMSMIVMMIMIMMMNDVNQRERLGSGPCSIEVCPLACLSIPLDIDVVRPSIPLYLCTIEGEWRCGVARKVWDGGDW